MHSSSLLLAPSDFLNGDRNDRLASRMIMIGHSLLFLYCPCFEVRYASTKTVLFGIRVKYTTHQKYEEAPIFVFIFSNNY